MTATALSHQTSAGRKVANVVVWLVVGFNILIFLWMLVTSLRSNRDIFANPFGLTLPPQWINYLNAWGNSNFGHAAVNSVLVTVGAGFVTLVLSSPAAFALGRSRRRISSTILMYFVAGMGIPAQVIIIPLFVVMAQLNLVNSLFGLAIVYVGMHLPFTIFLLAGFFRSLPDELEEAAAIDGATGFYAFWRVMLPLARSGLITAFILAVIGIWSETFIALVFIQSASSQTLPLALLGFRAAMQYSGADYGQLLAGICILVMPVFLLYLWLGSRIIEGMTLGSSK